jgi:DNA-binding response OmpR family regulator
MIKVLVVDDDEDLLEMVSMMLRMSGMEVQSLANGEHVFAAIDTGHPHIILMDIYLGDYDGRQLCKKIKSHREYAVLPVVLYSAGNINTASITEAGADSFLQKPFDMKALVTRIRDMSGVKEY